MNHFCTLDLLRYRFYSNGSFIGTCKEDGNGLKRVYLTSMDGVSSVGTLTVSCFILRTEAFTLLCCVSLSDFKRGKNERAGETTTVL